MATHAELAALERLFGAVHEAHAVSMCRIYRRFDNYANGSGGEGHIPGLIGDVDVADDIEMYEFALERATEQGNTDLVETLRRNGPPPYTRVNLVGHFQAMNGIVNDYMDAHAHGEGTGHNLAFDSMGAPEYGLLDKVYWGLSLLNTFPHVYSQLNDVDLREQALALGVPVFFIKGRWDINASNTLAEDYFALLDAPHKEWFWFEDSAHTPSWDEPSRFTDIMVNTVLEQTLNGSIDADR